MNDSNTSLIRSVTILGMCVIFAVVALVIWGPTDNGLLTTVIGTIVTMATLLVTNLLTLRASSDARAAAVEAVVAAKESKVASDKNAIKLSAVGDDVTKVAAAAEETHKIVNSQRTAMETKIEGLTTALAEVQKTLAVERAVKGP